MWLTTITPPSYSYVSFCSRFRIQMSLYTHPSFLCIKKNKCVVAAGIFNHLLRFPLIWPLFIYSYSSQLPYYLHHWTVRWLKEVRGSLTYRSPSPCMRTWRSCASLQYLLQRSWMCLTDHWPRRSWWPSLRRCAETTSCRGSTRTGWDGLKLNSIFLPQTQRWLKCLWCFSVLVSFHKCHLIDDLWTMIALLEFASFWTDCFIISAVMKIAWHL